MTIDSRILQGAEITGPTIAGWNEKLSVPTPGYDFRWLQVLQQGLGHQPYCVVAYEDGELTGGLPLLHVRSRLFGDHLISMPYVNVGGVRCHDPAAAGALIDRAVVLADQLNVNYLQLRQEEEIAHPAFNGTLKTKVHMRLPLPSSVEELRASFKSKVRSQVKKSESSELSVHWGREDLLPDFYTVFARNMRDLGTPVFGKRLFECILEHFADEAEICVLRSGSQPASAALLIHGRTATEVPSASTIREFNPLNANMLMYWHLLQRTVERGQPLFDFGRSTEGSSTYRFKKQWGSEPHPSVWQYYLRAGSVDDLRPDNASFAWKIEMWKKLPVWLTRLVGPTIVRGIP